MTHVPERRGEPRYELVAKANVASGGKAHLLLVQNISTTGAFVEGSPEDHSELTLGTELEVLLSATRPGMKEDEVVNIRCTGRIVRVEFKQPPRVGGFGLTIKPASPDDRARLRSLMVHLEHLPPPRPSTLRF